MSTPEDFQAAIAKLVEDSVQHMHTESDDYLAECKRRAGDFMLSLDRSVLDVFAVSDEALFWALIYEDNRRNSYRKNGYKFSSVQILCNSQFSKMTEDENDRARAEVVFWWERSDDENLVYWVESNQNIRAVNKHLKLLRRIAKSPKSYIQYFAVGIWSETAIKRLIADDIDPALAASTGI